MPAQILPARRQRLAYAPVARWTPPPARFRCHSGWHLYGAHDITVARGSTESIGDPVGTLPSTLNSQLSGLVARHMDAVYLPSCA